MELGQLINGNPVVGEYEINRSKYEDMFYTWMDKLGFDAYGFLKDNIIVSDTEQYLPYQYNSDIFSVFPYYWGDCTCGFCELEEDFCESIHANNDKKIKEFYTENFHKDSCLTILPNFHYKPKNITINWYKYMLRGAYCNIELDESIINDMMQECLLDINKLKP